MYYLSSILIGWVETPPPSYLMQQNTLGSIGLNDEAASEASIGTAGGNFYRYSMAVIVRLSFAEQKCHYP